MSPPKLAILGLVSIAVAGCSLPSAGPTVPQVERTADPKLDLYVVKVGPRIVDTLASYKAEGFPRSIRLQGYTANVALRPGDMVSVAIYEAGGTSLFGNTGNIGGGQQGAATPQPSSSTVASTLPAQLIEDDGRILIPFVGPVRIAGLTPAQAANLIKSKLVGQTVRPEVIVTLANNNSNAVSVGGEVNKSGIVPLSLRGEKLLDVIAQAGGPKYTAVETDVRLIRGSTVASIPLQQVLTNPQDNVAVRPNDNVVLVRNPKTFVVMGAVTKVAQYTMDTERVTVAEGIARAGGTVDAYGSLAGVFLLRSEPTSFARTVMSADAGAIDSRYVETDATRYLDGPRVRMIYRIDLTESGGYFYAQNIALRDKDIILVANAESSQVQKAMTLIRAFTGAYFDISRGATYYLPTSP